MELINRFIANATKWIGSAILLLMALQIVIDVFMRNVVGAGFPATSELVSKYYMLAVSFLPVAYSELKRRHVEASIFTNMLPKKLHPAVYFLGFAISLAAYGILAWGTAKEALVQTGRGAYVETGTLFFYTWPGYWILPVCFGLMALVVAYRLVQVLRGTFEDVPTEAAAVADPLNQME